MATTRRRRRQPEVPRRRILESAGRLFAARGFHGVGLRDVAREAGVSLRMANHRFGGKEELFAECVRYAFRGPLDFPALVREPPAGRNREERAKEIADRVRSCFFAVHPPSGRPFWCGDLVGRALVEHLPGCLDAKQDGLRPVREWFQRALAALRPGLTDDEFMLWYTSLWAHVSFYSTARPAILARLGVRRYAEGFLRAAADRLAQDLAAHARDGTGPDPRNPVERRKDNP